MTKKERIAALEAHAKHMRITALKMANRCGGNAHLGGGLSIMEAMAVLYGAVMNSRDLPYAEQDKFILSKGHGVLGLYAALAEFGVMDESLLDTFMQDGSDLIAHPVMKPEIGLEASSGSLGQGISMAAGLALAAKKKGYPYQTYVLCGNGEANEGSVWEACMSAVNYKLDNFTLGYTFPKLFEMVQGRPATLNIFGTVQNICTITRYSGIDPEVYGGIDGTVYPRPRTFVLGIKFNF